MLVAFDRIRQRGGIDRRQSRWCEGWSGGGGLQRRSGRMVRTMVVEEPLRVGDGL